MDCVLSGNQIKSLNRALVCMAKIGTELLIEALPDKIIFRTLNTSRSAFLSISFKVQFFDAYHISGTRAQCGVLLKSACTVFRTSPGNMNRLSICLDEENTNKLQWILDCHNGIRKTYWLSCISDDELQDVTVDKTTMPSHLVVKPRDLTRLLGHFQSSLQEITFIATEPLSTPTGSEPTEAKALEMRSYIDPAKENTDDALHTQLWIDPAEELQEYSHSGNASDVTFNVKELKAFASFCEGSEADMHMYFKKAGYPVLLAPRFGLDDTAHADFDATLVLATCQASQIQGTDSFDQETAASGHAVEHNRQTSQDQDNSRGVSQRNLGSRSSTPRSDHTFIWSELSGSAERTTPVQAGRREAGKLPNSLDASEEIAFHLHVQHNNPASAPRALSAEAVPMDVDIGIQGRQTPVQELRRVPDTSGVTPQQQAAADIRLPTQDERPALARNLSNWVSGDVDDDEDDDTVGEDYCVPSTPPDKRGLY